MRLSESMNQHLSNQSFILSSGSFGCNMYYQGDGAAEDKKPRYRENDKMFD
jgi:hypothetical protein